MRILLLPLRRHSIIYDIRRGKLAELAGLSSGAATTVIDRMEKSGFVRREPVPQDRRKTIL
ncbi:MarR family transcriptional regulator [Paenibacillus sp. 32O-W]|nr:MarR family transcriptional regulator [Paenibacillus sp. 32O-W]